MKECFQRMLSLIFYFIIDLINEESFQNESKSLIVFIPFTLLFILFLDECLFLIFVTNK